MTVRYIDDVDSFIEFFEKDESFIYSTWFQWDMKRKYIIGFILLNKQYVLNFKINEITDPETQVKLTKIKPAFSNSFNEHSDLLKSYLRLSTL